MASAGREYKDRGTELLVKGKAAAALEEFRKAVAADPEDTAARRKVAEVLARLGKKQEAILQYQALAGRLAVKGRVLDAAAISKVILSLDPSHTETLQALAQFTARQPNESWRAKLPKPMAAQLDPPPRDDEVEITGGPIAALPALPREAMSGLLQEVELRVVKAGDQVFAEGEPGAAMFVVVEGALEASHRGRVVERLVAGGVFGEISVLADVPRIATVRATEDALLVEVPRLVFERLEQKYPLLRELLRGFFKDRLVASVMRGGALFQSFSPDEQKRLAGKFELRQAKRGDELVKPGSAGTGLWVILRGKCVAYDVPSGAIHWEMGEGAVFGVMALMEEQPASAGYRAETDCTLLFFDRESFNSEIRKNPQAVEYLGTLARERLGRIEIAQPALGAALL